MNINQDIIKKDKSHNMNSKVVNNEEEYKKLEKWQLYYELQKLDKEKIDLNKKQDTALVLIGYFVFIFTIVQFIFK